MLTQAMPAYIDALRQAVPAAMVAPLAQAFGNCAQPLTHRGGINFAAPTRPNQNGVYNSQSWNPAQFQNLYPGGGTYNSPSYHNQVDLGGMSLTWNEGNRYDSQFFFPTNQVFTQNQFYGGPTVHVSGGQYIDYITNEVLEGDTVNVNNVTTETLNGDPVAGPAGPPGAAGKDGQRGAPGAPGVAFGALPPGFFGAIRYLGGNPRIRYVPERVARPHRHIKDAWVRKQTLVNIPTNSIAGGTVTVVPQHATVDVPTNAISGGTMVLNPSPVLVEVPLTLSFDAANCSISIDSTTTFYAFPYAPPTQTLLSASASMASVTVAATSAVTATLEGEEPTTVSVYAASTAASTLASYAPSNGILVKGADADFWQRAPASVVVAREPKLVGFVPQVVRVFQQ